MSQIIQPGNVLPQKEVNPKDWVKLSVNINPKTGEIFATGGDRLPAAPGTDAPYIGLKIISDMFNSILTFNKYQQMAAKTAVYPKEYTVSYPALGLAGEAGEVCNKIKKVYRDDKGKLTEERRAEIVSELGDVLWYVSQLAKDIGVPMEQIAVKNIEKLAKRMEENKLQGEGDNR